MSKYKKKVAWLKQRQAWWENQSKQYQSECKKPGSVKVR